MSSRLGSKWLSEALSRRADPHSLTAINVPCLRRVLHPMKNLPCFCQKCVRYLLASALQLQLLVKVAKLQLTPKTILIREMHYFRSEWNCCDVVFVWEKEKEKRKRTHLVTYCWLCDCFKKAALGCFCIIWKRREEEQVWRHKWDLPLNCSIKIILQDFCVHKKNWKGYLSLRGCE